MINEQLLVTVPAGSVFLGDLPGRPYRPCTFVKDSQMARWVTQDPFRQDLAEGTALVYCFNDASLRDQYIKERGWLRDGHLYDQMWELYRGTAPGEASRAKFEIAYIDAQEPIQRLPCGSCGIVAWPVLAKPKGGSEEWWEDPTAFWACRVCGAWMGDLSRPVEKWASFAG